MMIRERRPEDDAAIARIIREVAPGWVTSVRGVTHRRLTTPERARRRDWVAEEDGAVVAWSSGGLKTDGDRDDVAWLNVFVLPAWRGRGLGGELYAPLEAHVRELGAKRWLGDGPDEPEARRFVERHGFRHTMTTRLSSLDPHSVDGAELDALAARKEAEGFTLAPFASFAASPELLYAVDAEASLDEPADEPITDWPYDEWLASNWEQPDLTQEGSFCAVHEGRPVAIAELRLDLEGSRAANGFTGTLRDFRGRGLARLTKLASIAWLREQGVTTLVTQNDETNQAMLAVNRRLGYERGASWLAYVKDLE
jgi:GNAT superfamily N-acetyltransferase